MQVLQKYGGPRPPTNPLVRLIHEHLLLFFLFVRWAGYGVELRLEATIWDTIVLHLYIVLQVVLVSGALNQDGCTLNLQYTIVLNVDFPC